MITSGTHWPPVVALSILLFVTNGQAAGQQNTTRADGRVPAPSLDDGTAWLNTDVPLRLSDLRGKIVVLDFWTLC